MTSNLEYLCHDAPFLRDAPVVSQAAKSDLATAEFHRDEIQIGKLLHETGFFNHYEVLQLPQSDEDIRLGTKSNYDAYAARVSVCTSGELYTIKHLSKKHAKHRQSKEDDMMGETNLVLEAKYLSKLNHENIIKLKGIPFEAEAVLAQDRHDAFFIMTNQIVERLVERVARWKAHEDATVPFSTKTPQFKKKMVAIKGIASALQYLHERGIMLITLSPDTIGFLENGTAQLCDLSTCREVPPTLKGRPLQTFEASAISLLADDEDDSEEHFDPNNNSADRKLMPTPEHGTVPRYMAPEVVTKGQYTLKCDVYSFAMVAFEMLTLSKPFASMQTGQHLLKVCFEAKRPSLGSTGMPKNLQALLSRAWRQDTAERMSMNTVIKALRSLHFDKKPSSSSGTKKSATKERPDKAPVESPTPQQRPRRGGMERTPGNVSTRRGMMSSARAAQSMRGFGGRSSAMQREKSMRIGMGTSPSVSTAQREMAAGSMTPGRAPRPKMSRGMMSDRNIMGLVATPKATKKKALQLRREASVRDF